MKKIICFALCLMSLFTLFACGKSDIKGNGQKGTLSINVYAAGYGTGWIDSAVNSFKKLYPDVKVKVESSPLALGSIQTTLENGNCKNDVILVGATNYESFISKGYLEDLTDLYDTIIPGTEKKVKDCIYEELIDKYTTSDGKIYGVNWQPNYASGLVYNKKMFREYGWSIPETMDEFFALCEQIDKDTDGTITPLTFGGADGNGYLYTVLPQWLTECYGKEKMDEFYRLESPKAYQDQEEGRTKIYKTLAKLSKGTLSSGRDITLEGSAGATAIAAQTNFISERCAMIVNGTWFMTEMQEYIELRNFEVGYMPMPHINSDKKSIDGTIDTSRVRYSADNGVFAVPSTSLNKDLAKAFIVSMMTSESYTSFIESTNGLNRFFKDIEVDTTNFNDFAKAAYEYFRADGNPEFNFAFSRDRLIERSTLSVFFAYKGSFFERIVGAKDYASALSIAEGCFLNEMDCVYQKWDAANEEWKS